MVRARQTVHYCLATHMPSFSRDGRTHALLALQRYTMVALVGG